MHITVPTRKRKNFVILSAKNFAGVAVAIQIAQTFLGIIGLNEILIAKYSLRSLESSHLNAYNIIILLALTIIYAKVNQIKLQIERVTLNSLLMFGLIALLMMHMSGVENEGTAITKLGLIHFLGIYYVLALSTLITSLASPKIHPLTLALILAFLCFSFFTGRRGVIIFPMIAVALGLAPLFGKISAPKKILAIVFAVGVLVFGRENSIQEISITSILAGLSTFDGYPFSVLAFQGIPYAADLFANKTAGFGLGVDSPYIFWSAAGPLLGSLALALYLFFYVRFFVWANKFPPVRGVVVFVAALSIWPLKNPTNFGQTIMPTMMLVLAITVQKICAHVCKQNRP